MKYPTIRLIHIVCLSLWATLLAANAHAQVTIDDAVAHIGIGAGITFYNPTNDDGQTSNGIAVVYRWHSFHSGWGPTFGLDWHSTDFDQTLGALNAPLGSLRMRALLAGFGHTRHVGRFSTSATVSGGYAFNTFTVANDAIPRFASTGVSLVGADVDNSWVVRPDVAVWYDVFRHVGVGVSAAYLVARPDETVTTAASKQEQHLKADTFELTAGVTLGVWRKKH
jgi:hypothetical protein